MVLARFDSAYQRASHSITLRVMSIKGYLAPKQVALGRLVLRTESPGQDYCPDAPVALSSEIAFREFECVSKLLDRYSDSRYRISLTRLFSAGSTASNNSADWMQSARATTYQLLNSGAFFEKITKDQNPQEWLERFLRRGPVYLVVGLHTVESVSINASSNSTQKKDLCVQVPVTEIAVAVGVPWIPGNPLDIRMNAMKATQIETAASFVAPGERIVKVEYRKLLFHTFRSCDVGSAYLERGSRWKTYTTSRKVVGPDAVEVNLGEDVDVDYCYVDAEEDNMNSSG